MVANVKKLIGSSFLGGYFLIEFCFNSLENRVP